MVYPNAPAITLERKLFSSRFTPILMLPACLLCMILVVNEFATKNLPIIFRKSDSQADICILNTGICSLKTYMSVFNLQMRIPVF